MNVRLLTACLVALLTAAGCGSGGDGDATGPPIVIAPGPMNASPGGLWQGVDGATGLTVLGLVTETGEFHFLRDDGVQFFGALAVSNTTVSGMLTGVTPIGSTFSDGTISGMGTYTGALRERVTLNGSISFQTSAGQSSTSTVNLDFLALYNRDSSLGTIAGNYRDPATNAVVNVSAGGVVFSQDPVTGCIINGTVSIIDARYNAYRVEYSFAGCRGIFMPLNGTTARGLATLDNTALPELAIIGVVNAPAGYSLVQVLPRT